MDVLLNNITHPNCPWSCSYRYTYSLPLKLFVPVHLLPALEAVRTGTLLPALEAVRTGTLFPVQTLQVLTERGP